jgi:hypothetical protein
MFWLNVFASSNACEPSPDGSGWCITVHAASSEPSACGAMLLALDGRDSAELRRLDEDNNRREPPCSRWGNTREMSEAHKQACTAAGSIGRGRRHRRNAAPHPRPRHPRLTLTRWYRAHTKLILVIEAVFQAPMFALNVFAPQNACEPSRALKEHAPHQPRAPMVSPVNGARSVQWAECVRSEVQALEIRGNCGGWMWASRRGPLCCH